LSEIEYSQFSQPRYLQTVKNGTAKRHPASNRPDQSQVYSKGTALKFSSKILVNGYWYYRTEFDTNNNNNLGIAANDLEEMYFVQLDSPRFMEIKNNTKNINPITGEVGETIITGTHVKFASKISINGVWYYRSEAEDSS